MSDELLPCPFCGNKPAIQHHDDSCTIECMTFGCVNSDHTYFGWKEDDLPKQWNTRHSITEALPKTSKTL